MTLPDAVQQTPACGACGSSVDWDGDEWYCEDCRLYFRADDLSASFIHPDAEVCGAACDNYWHGEGRIKQGWGYDCGTCRLPEDHTSMHWTGCQPRSAAGVAI